MDGREIWLVAQNYSPRGQQMGEDRVGVLPKALPPKGSTPPP